MKRTYFILLVAIVVTLVVGAIVTVLTSKGVRDLAAITIKPTKVLDVAVSAPALSSDGATLFFADVAQGGLYKATLSTKSVDLLSALSNASVFEWSPDRSQALVTVIYQQDKFEREKSPFVFPEAYDGALTWWIVDSAGGPPTLLPLGVTSAAWDRSGTSVYYHFLDPFTDTSELTVRDVETKTRATLTHLPPAPSYTIQMLDPDTLLLVANVSDTGGATSILLFDLSTHKMTALAENQVYAAYGSPDGSYVLYETAGEEHTWHLIDRKTGKDSDLGLTVLRHRAAWIDAQRFMVIEYRQTATDRLWLVNPKDLTRQEIFLTSDTPFHVDYVLPAVGQSVYVTSDGILFKLDLP